MLLTFSLEVGKCLALLLNLFEQCLIRFVTVLHRAKIKEVPLESFVLNLPFIVSKALKNYPMPENE
jgi:hypothetical protein